MQNLDDIKDGYYWAKHKNSDPFVCQIVTRKKPAGKICRLVLFIGDGKRIGLPAFLNQAQLLKKAE